MEYVYANAKMNLKKKTTFVFMLAVIVDLFVKPPLTKPFGCLGVSR